MSPASAPNRSFRPEIQALRALAVLLVVAYHLEPEILPGGYIGVDIFFVISGFLITSHLLREARATGSIDLAGFFAGRARRILPAAMAVILAAAAATMLFLPKTLWEALGQQALASAFSVQNWVLAANSVDYLAADREPGPLQHFWSLGVEEQFYLLWPLIILAVCWFVKPSRERADGFARRRKTLWIAFSLMAALSLACSIFTGYSGNAAGYFMTTTRIWELAAGGLLALASDAVGHQELTLPRWMTALSVRNAAVLLALVAIFWAAVNYSPSTVFPGIAAAVPVAACALIIAAGSTSGPGSLHHLVRWAPVQWMGLASYSLYLWHWPLIAFFIQLAGHRPKPIQTLALIALSLLLAWASLNWIETPLRGWRPLAAFSLRSLAAGAVAVVLVGTLGLLPAVVQRNLAERAAASTVALLDHPPEGFGAASVPTGAPALLPGVEQVVPLPASAADDQPQLGGCVQEPQSTRIQECEFGSKKATYTVALVGDSHAAHWYEALSGYAQQRGWKLVTYLKNSCPFSAARRTAEAAGEINCSQANAQTMQELKQRKDIDAVILANWGGSRFKSDAAQGLAAAWGELEDAGLDLYPIIDTPRPPQDSYSRDCVEKNAADPKRCDFPAAAAFDPGDATRAAAKLEPRVDLLAFNDQFCMDGTCPAVIGNVLVYRDKHHVSDTYMRTLVAVFGQRLERALQD
ncbi:acyltransferase family protein [Glutamicibacter sp.]|uniref:acyltransferase family protein n=1 Tax=Glutamicibacter sp. TaxID=1931995 RepID=UPI0028BF3456|nr:acyltransferase family protein [Glutamicibacter sp.]